MSGLAANASSSTPEVDPAAMAALLASIPVIPPDDEMWIEYGIAVFIMLFRFYARIKIVGIRNLQLDDLFMGIALVTYTAVVIMIHQMTKYGTLIGFNDETVWILPQEMVDSLVVGQKLVFFDWFVYLIYGWSLKAALLVLFNRLTSRLGRFAIMVKIVTWYTVLAFVGAFLSHMLSCLPLQKGWQIRPYPGDACAVRSLNWYLVTPFNVSSDLAIAVIPLPVIFAAKISLRRRITLALLLCSGMFAAVAAFLRAYYTLQDLEGLQVIGGWTARELAVSAIVVSLPGIKPLFSQSSWFRLRPSQDEYRYGSGAGKLEKGYGGGSALGTRGGGEVVGSANRDGDHELAIVGGEGSSAAAAADSASDGKKLAVPSAVGSEWPIVTSKGLPSLPSMHGSEDSMLGPVEEAPGAGSRRTTIHVKSEFSVTADRRVN